MKNISRRVFIKGLAVAGVAAAASTVLAGCNTNMIPGVDDGAEDDTTEDVTPGNVQTITWTDQATDKKLTIKVTDVVENELEKKVYLHVEVLNNLGGALFIGKATTSTTGTTYDLQALSSGAVVVKNAANVDISGADADVADDVTPGSENLHIGAGTEVGDGETVKGIFVLEGIDKTWNKMTVNFNVGKKIDAAAVIATYGTTKIELTNK